MTKAQLQQLAAYYEHCLKDGPNPWMAAKLHIVQAQLDMFPDLEQMEHLARWDGKLQAALAALKDEQ